MIFKPICHKNWCCFRHKIFLCKQGLSFYFILYCNKNVFLTSNPNWLQTQVTALTQNSSTLWYQNSSKQHFTYSVYCQFSSSCKRIENHILVSGQLRTLLTSNPFKRQWYQFLIQHLLWRRHVEWITIKDLIKIKFILLILRIILWYSFIIVHEQSQILYASFSCETA